MSSRLLRASLATALGLCAAVSLAGVGLPTPAAADPAERWVLMIESDGLQGFVDMASIRRDGDIGSMRVMMAPDHPEPISGGMVVDYAYGFMEYDCPRKMERMVRAGAFGPKGDLLYDGAAPKAFEAEDPADAETALFRALACDGAKPAPGPEFPTMAAAAIWARGRSR